MPAPCIGMGLRVCLAGLYCIMLGDTLVMSIGAAGGGAIELLKDGIGVAVGKVMS